MAQVWRTPALIEANFAPLWTIIGTRLQRNLVLSPPQVLSPRATESCPYRLLPQQYASPLVLIAQLCSAPTLTLCQLLEPISSRIAYRRIVVVGSEHAARSPATAATMRRTPIGDREDMN